MKVHFIWKLIHMDFCNIFSFCLRITWLNDDLIFTLQASAVQRQCNQLFLILSEFLNKITTMLLSDMKQRITGFMLNIKYLIGVMCDLSATISRRQIAILRIDPWCASCPVPATSEIGHLAARHSNEFYFFCSS